MFNEAQNCHMNVKIDNEDFGAHASFGDIHVEKNSAIEELESSLETCNPKIHNVIESLGEDLDLIENSETDRCQVI